MPPVRLVSVDVFDTAIVRLVGNPHAIFWFVGRRIQSMGLVDFGPSTFSSIRIQAEIAARRQQGVNRYTLQEIYDLFPFYSGIDRTTAERIKSMEVQIEDSFIEAVPSMKRQLASLRKDLNLTVRFLSDMYLPKKVIWQLLESRGIALSESEILLSNDQGTSKTDGTSFRRLIETTQILPADIWHCGNDFHSDFMNPKKLGIEASHFLEGNLNRFERIFELYASDSDYFSSVLAGCSRRARLSFETADPLQKELITFGASVAAPILASFVIWVLEDAKKTNRELLLFTARDGQILYQIASLLKERTGYQGRLEYFYGSRQALHLPSLANEKSIQASKWLMSVTGETTYRAVFQRLGLNIEEFGSSLAAISIEHSKFDSRVDHNLMPKLIDVFNEPKALAKIRVLAREQQSLLINYLGQFGISHKTNWGLVDIGWFGHSLDSLISVIENGSLACPNGYYFGLYQRETSKPGQRNAFLFDQNLGTGYGMELNCLSLMMEVMCTADHGTTTGYVELQSRVKPVLSNRLSGIVKQEDLLLFRNAVSFFCQALAKTPEEALVVHARQAVAHVLKEFIQNPSRESSILFQRFEFEEDHNSSRSEPIVFPYHLKDLAGFWRQGPTYRRLSTEWPQGCLLVTPIHIRFLRKSIISFKRIARKIRSSFRKIIVKTF
jgi:FMN phosphatase YigB (HAD superfamily)